MTYQVLTDKEVKKYYNFEKIVSLFEKIFVEKSEGTLTAPPRYSVSSQLGSLVFTVGGSSPEVENVIGFRVYDTFPPQKDHRVDKNQLTVLFDNTTGALTGVIVGNLIGPIRTAAINALAIKKMSRKESSVLGVIGTGNQARWHVEAACAIRNIKTIKIFSRRKNNRDSFVKFIRDKLHIETISCETSKQAVEDADILLCLTNSTEPIFNADDIQEGTHINSIGPKFADAHEVPLEILSRTNVLVTDSLDQTKNYSKPFFLTETNDMQRLQELSDVVSEDINIRRKDSDISLFCSVGLAGTEVVLAKFIVNEFTNST